MLVIDMEPLELSLSSAGRALGLIIARSVLGTV
jgi:hypothetical protein